MHEIRASSPRTVLKVCLTSGFIVVGVFALMLWWSGGNTVVETGAPAFIPEPGAISNLESALSDTAWIQLDPSGEKTDFEIDFQKTKDNDPLHTAFDYQDFLHHRPGVSGYWHVENDTITIDSQQLGMPPTTYTGVHLSENTLQMTDSFDDTKQTFMKLPSK